MVWKEPGKDKDPWNSTEHSADLERILKSLQKRLGWLLGVGKRGGPHRFHTATLWWLVPVIIAAWLVSGFYKVAPGDRGVHFMFGRYTGIVQPGLHWHAPWPLGHADIISSVQGRDYTRNYNRLLTRDGNLVVVDAIAHYHVVDAPAYLFNTATAMPVLGSTDAGTQALLGMLTDAAVRAAVAQSSLANILGDGRDAVEADAREHLDAALKPYHAGLSVTRLVFQRVSVPTAVSSADADVGTARQDASQAEDAARAQADKLLPQAQTAADAKLAAAEAYRSNLVSQAQADTTRFDTILVAYRKAPALTRDELYVQTMEDILANADKVVVDTRSGSVTVQLGNPFQSPAPIPTASPSGKSPAKNAGSVTPPAAAATTQAAAASTKGGA